MYVDKDSKKNVACGPKVDQPALGGSQSQSLDLFSRHRDMKSSKIAAALASLQEEAGATGWQCQLPSVTHV